jgi:hypothetical protein
MDKEEKKGTEDRAKNPDFECIPKNGQKMFEMMNKCCAGGFPDFSSMMKAMGNQDCCTPKTEETDREGGKK